MRRRTFLQRLGYTLPAATAFGPLLRGVGAAETYELVIRGGRVMDPETRLDGVRNVGIAGGKIIAISASALDGKQTIDATGLIVAPGFIDLHQHGQDAENYEVKAHDGVTTALEMEVGVGDVDAWYSAREGKALIHYGASAGHIPARMQVMHDPGGLLPSGDAAHRVATPQEVDQVKAIVEKGLRRGALGMGIGPAYTFAATNWEIVQMFQIAAKYGAPVHVHIRALPDDKEGNLSGFEEVLAAAAATGAPLHIVHIQSTSGPNTGHQLEMIASAQSRGMDVTSECYPYSMGMTSIQSAIFDHKENEPDSYYASLLWPATGEHLTRETFLQHRRDGGYVILPSNTEENVHLAVINPTTMIASDGFLQNGKGHPRTAGCYSRVLGKYVREEKSLDLMTALAKMSLLPAQRLEKHAPVFVQKGRLQVGADGDVTVFDAARVLDKATYEKPAVFSEGIQHVVVSGTPVVSDGKTVDGVLPGRGLRAPITSA